MQHPGPIATEAEHAKYLAWFHNVEGKRIWFEKLKREERLATCLDCGAPIIKLHTLTKKTKQISSKVYWVELGDGRGQASYTDFYWRGRRKHLQHKCGAKQ